MLVHHLLSFSTHRLDSTFLRSGAKAASRDLISRILPTQRVVMLRTVIALETVLNHMQIIQLHPYVPESGVLKDS